MLASVLMQLGVAFPGPLNESLDNLWFTLLFKRRGALLDSDCEFGELARAFVNRLRPGQRSPDAVARRIEELVRVPRDGHPVSQLQPLAVSMLENDVTSSAPEGAPVAWKEPNTHVVLERLLMACPDARYIHLERHGLDMALSENQNQLKLWGPIFLDRPVEIGPRDSLSYWCAAHRRIGRLASEYPGRILSIRFEDLCADTIAAVSAVADFAGVNVNEAGLAAIDEMCAPPSSSGRYRQAQRDIFLPQDVEYVASKGYAVD